MKLLKVLVYVAFQDCLDSEKPIQPNEFVALRHGKDSALAIKVDYLL